MSEAQKAFFARLYGPVEEAMQELHAHMPWGAEIKLANGTVLKMKKFAQVEEKDGRFQFGFDLANDEMHLEFHVRHTGGGGTPPADLQALFQKELDDNAPR